MQPDRGPEKLVGRTAEEALLDAPATARPASLGDPPALPAEAPGRGLVVAAGVVMTGVTLLLGLALIAWALVSSFENGADGARGALFALGAVLVATHWGWVHVAELSARRLATRRGRGAIATRAAWLAAVEPYPRCEVSTEVEPDGCIAVVTHLYRPVARGCDRFGFADEELSRERLPEETPTATVAERVEEARQLAAAETAAARERHRELSGGHAARTLDAGEEAALLAERRATARALSERLNAHLREPPLDG